MNEILFHRMPNIWNMQAYVHGIGFEAVIFKKAIRMIERMETAENIYEGVL